MTVTLQASFEVTAEKGLSIRTRIENGNAADILVLDRLWRLVDGKKELDPEHVYRFVRDDSLRLLLGPAPLPRLKSALYRNVPLATRVRAGGTLEHEIVIPAPIKEYSPYFPEIDPERYEVRAITTVHLVVSYVVDDLVDGKPRHVLRAATVDPTAIEIENPVFAIANAKLVIDSSPLEAPLDASRRTDEFGRLALPGEPQEALQLA